MNRFRFGVQASMGVSTGLQWTHLAREVESLGYSTLFVPDHLDDGQFSPIVALTAAAMATSSLKVGSLMFSNDYRQPVVLAREMLTLDLISDGRLEVGIGAGWKRSDYDQTGIPFDSPGARILRLGESVSILKSLWRDGTCNFQGQFFHIRDSVGLPRPASEGGPKLAIGGGGKKILSLAGEHADIVGINPSLAAGEVGPSIVASVGPEQFRKRVEWVRAAAGPRFSSLELQCLTYVAHVAPDGSRWLDEMAGGFGLSGEEARSIPIVLAGCAEEVIETLRERRELYGFSYWVIHQSEMVAFAPVVDALTGT